MNQLVRIAAVCATVSASLIGVTQAHEGAASPASGLALTGDGLGPVRADGHAPIGVMGDHMHKKGEWMLSYRFMRMKMEDNRIGNRKISPEEIVTTIPNTFFGMPGQPPTLRVVPTDMTMDMHMLGAMYAPTDWLTLMVMGSYVSKEMTHITFKGPVGTTRLGKFTTKAEGLGDTKVSGLLRLYQDAVHKLHLNAGLSLPTGSVTEKDTILTPMNTRPRVRLPYAMQLGSGTFDLIPGITYTGRKQNVGWGAQYLGTYHLGDNDEDWSEGTSHELTAWASYQWAPWISTSLRLDGQSSGKINGQDSEIVGPVQTADTGNYGGERLDLLFGVNLAVQSGPLRGLRLALEAGTPLYQDLHGPQMEMEYQFILGGQYAF